MKLHYSDTEISYAPMMRPEIEYWLWCGHTLFLHKGIWWMKITHYNGHRVLMEAPLSEVREVLNKSMYEQVGCTLRMKKGHIGAYIKSL